MILTVAAQKGGTGKTTTAAAIAQALDHKGRTVLLVDADAQGSASLIYGAEPSPGLYAAIVGELEAGSLVQHLQAGDILPASPKLDRLDVELAKDPKRDYMLRDALKPLGAAYTDIIIDTAPGMGTVLIQALTAFDAVLVPLQADAQSLQGLHQITDTIMTVKRYTNDALQVAGVVVVQYDGRPRLPRQYDELIRKQCGQLGVPFADTHIRKSVAVQEAQALRMSLYEYAASSNPARDYMELVEELDL